MIVEQPAVEPQTNEKPKWAIAGGGMLGLSLALRMAKQGHDVTLIEAAP